MRLHCRPTTLSYLAGFPSWSDPCSHPTPRSIRRQTWSNKFPAHASSSITTCRLVLPLPLAHPRSCQHSCHLCHSMSAVYASWSSYTSRLPPATCPNHPPRVSRYPYIYVPTYAEAVFEFCQILLAAQNDSSLQSSTGDILAPGSESTSTQHSRGGCSLATWGWAQSLRQSLGQL